jgi:hypothetical protein
MHCHIAWHTADGFALQLLERESEMTALMDVTNINMCELEHLHI